MAELAALIEHYRTSLQVSAPVAPPGEQCLYVLHSQELERLSLLLVAGARSSAIADLVAGENDT